MNKEKLIYLSPETETLVVRAEGVICGSPTGYHAYGGGYYDVEDTNNNGDY